MLKDSDGVNLHIIFISLKSLQFLSRCDREYKKPVGLVTRRCESPLKQ